MGEIRLATLLWNGWQLSRGTGGSLRLESVAALPWNTHPMAVSLETRNPILDYRLIGPALAAMDKYPESANPKWAIKTILGNHVPSEYFDRPKQGFGIPFLQWLKNEIRPWMETLISKDRIERDGFFDWRRINTAWKEFLSGDQITWGPIFWRLLISQAWHDNFQVPASKLNK